MAEIQRRAWSTTSGINDERDRRRAGWTTSGMAKKRRGRWPLLFLYQTLLVARPLFRLSPLRAWNRLLTNDLRFDGRSGADRFFRSFTLYLLIRDMILFHRREEPLGRNKDLRPGSPISVDLLEATSKSFLLKFSEILQTRLVRLVLARKRNAENKESVNTYSDESHFVTNCTFSPLALVVYILLQWTNTDVLFKETMLFILITVKGKQRLGD